jgi:hypothetical protein
MKGGQRLRGERGTYTLKSGQTSRTTLCPNRRAPNSAEQTPAKDYRNNKNKSNKNEVNNKVIVESIDVVVIKPNAVCVIYVNDTK